MTIDKENTHSFDWRMACLVGVEKAILVGGIHFWITENEAKKSKSHFQAGEYWTYDTAKSLSEKYPYLNDKSIARWIGELENSGWIKTGRFSKDNLNKTKWYGRGKTLTEFLNTSIPQNEKSEGVDIDPIPQNENSISQNETSIPQNEKTIYKDTVNKLTVNKPVIKQQLDAGEEKLIFEDQNKGEQAPTPLSPPPSTPIRPIPIPQGKIYGDGKLQTDVLAFYRDNPDQFPLHIYLPFLRYWTAKKQKGDPANIGTETWRTMDRWDIETRLNNWNEREQKSNQGNANYATPRTPADFLARQRAAEPQSISDYGDF